ncbi:MAG: flagellar hook protein FlgE [Bacteroidetes bacterium]|nr:flagellar hook protein FlgE [Bacteroidota bacterium]
MINSLRSGVSGIRAHQVRMDVIGNNIANVNTPGFKRSRVAFHEVLAQLQLGLGRIAGGSGINPSYAGRGVHVGAIDQDWTQGSFETTNRRTDLALSGDGFFLASGSDQTFLTRAGNFTFNSSGELVTATGLNVQGWQIDANGNIDMSQLRDVQVDFLGQSSANPKFTENVMLTGNLSADAATGESITISTAIYDEQGTAYNAIIEFTKSATDNEWGYEIRYDGAVAPPPFATVTGTVVFGIDGSLTSPATVSLTWDTAYVTGGDPITVNLSEITQFSGSTTSQVSSQDGYQAGNFVSYSIDSNGILLLNFSNGENKQAFQLALGNVYNPNGLLQLGENLYGLSAASGDLLLGRAGFEFETSVVAGALEMSNVDLATEFTDMIVTQRGYQASARVITTSDELLLEIVQLKR